MNKIKLLQKMVGEVVYAWPITVSVAPIHTVDSPGEKKVINYGGREGQTTIKFKLKHFSISHVTLKIQKSFP